MAFFEQCLGQADQGSVEILAGWGQGRATFGGLVGALLYQRLASLLPGSRLRSMTVNFVGPVAPGAAQLEAEIIRQGKSVTQAQARLLQDGQVQAVMLASFGEARESAIQIIADPAPDYGSPEDKRALPVIDGVTPDFLRYFDVRWAEGFFPFSGGEHGNLGGWQRFREGQAEGELSVAHLITHVDVWPPATLGMLKKPAPASSMTWTLELVDDLAGQQADDWFQYRAHTEFAADGYTHAAARFWDKSGKLLAISRQTAVVFG